MPLATGQRAHMVARLGVMRLGASRLDFYQPLFKVVIDDVDRTGATYIGGATIQQSYGEPNTLTFRVSDFVPPKGADIRVYMGDTDVAHRLFSGRIQKRQQVLEDGISPNTLAWTITALDYTWMLNRRRVMRKWTSKSVDYIVTDILTDFTSGFDVPHVEQGLRTLDEFTCTNETVSEALDRLSAYVGGVWSLRGLQVRFVLTNTERATTLVDNPLGLGFNDMSAGDDLASTRTEVYSRGGGSEASLTIPPGETSLPVIDASWYPSTNLSFTNATHFATAYVESGPQHISYTGVQLGGTSTTLPAGPTTNPSVPGVAQANSGNVATFVAGSIPSGIYKFKVTYIIDGIESGASPAATVTLASVDTPVTYPIAHGRSGSFQGISNTGGSMTNTGVYRYRVTYLTAEGETLGSSDQPPDLWGGTDGAAALTLLGTAVSLQDIPKSPDARVTSRRIYRTAASGTAYRLVTTIADNTTGTYKDTLSDGALSGQPLMPTVAAVQKGKVDVTSISIGPTGTTARKIYRTENGGSTYKLLATIADNTTTTYQDNLTTLGATLATDSPGASIGDTTMKLVDLSQVPASGWLRVGDNLIKYTGRSASSGEGTVTGIPSSGFGSITVNIPVAAAVVVEPHLTGVAGIGYQITAGDPVNILWFVGDFEAIGNFGDALENDGVFEDFIQDGRLSSEETKARGFARLEERKSAVEEVTFESHDQTMRAGREITIDLTAPAVSGTYLIRSVTITDIAIGGTANYVFPLRNVQASSQRFTIEQLWRTLKNQQDA